MAPGNGIADSGPVEDAIGIAAKTRYIFDMNALALRHGSVISAAMFGALAGSGVLSFPHNSYTEVIRHGGKGVDASIRTFEAATDALAKNYQLGIEILRCRRLVKGYSDTHARGLCPNSTRSWPHRARREPRRRGRLGPAAARSRHYGCSRSGTGRSDPNDQIVRLGPAMRSRKRMGCAEESHLPAFSAAPMLLFLALRLGRRFYPWCYSLAAIVAGAWLGYLSLK